MEKLRPQICWGGGGKRSNGLAFFTSGVLWLVGGGGEGVGEKKKEKNRWKLS